MRHFSFNKRWFGFVLFCVALAGYPHQSLAAPATLEDFWNGRASFIYQNRFTFPTDGQYALRAMNVGMSVVVANGKWYLFHRQYYVKKPDYCKADYSAYVVRSSVDRGFTWSAPVEVVTPVPGGPNECANVDGGAFYDETTDSWHLMLQTTSRSSPWEGSHASLIGSDPMHPFQLDPQNPVVKSSSLWNKIKPGGGILDEGTFDIVEKKGNDFYVTFHGFDGVNGYRGVAKTADFHTWEAVNHDAIFKKADGDLWNHSWAAGGSVGGGAASILKEKSYYYELIEVPDKNLGCVEGQNWTFGLVRSEDLTATKWESHPRNPIITDPQKLGGCGVQYAQLFRDGNGENYLLFYRVNGNWSEVDRDPASAIYLYKLTTDSPIAEYHFREGAGASHRYTQPDGISSQGPMEGFLQNTQWVPSIPQWPESIDKFALKFNGLNSAITIKDNPAFNLIGDVSLSVRLSLGGVPAAGGSSWIAGKQGSYWFEQYPNGDLCFWIKNNSGTHPLCQNVPLNSTATYTGNYVAPRMTLLKEGRQIKSVEVTGSGLTNGDTPFRIGNTGSGGFYGSFSGVLEMVGVNDRLPTFNGAVFVSQSVPETMSTGHVYSATVTMKNTGTTDWTPFTQIRLGSQNPTDNSLWLDPDNRVVLSEGDRIPPGGTKSFVFTVTPPRTPGVYNFQWGMLREELEWFGDLSPNVKITVLDGISPVVSLTAPLSNVSFTWPQNVAVSATATDNVGVAKVWFVLDDRVVSTDTVAPYEYAWSVTSTDDGAHTWSATAFDAMGNSSTTAITPVFVDIDATPPVAPSSLTALEASSTSVHLSWSASTDNVGVLGYHLLRGTVPIATMNTEVTTYSDTGLLPNTQYRYTVSAFDAAGNESVPSIERIVTTAPPLVAQWEVVSSVETNANKTLRAFVEMVYQGVLGRPGEVGGIDYHVASVANKTVTLAQMGTGFLLSAESGKKNTDNTKIVQAAYRGFFGREPDAGGLDYWVNRLNQGMTVATYGATMFSGGQVTLHQVMDPTPPTVALTAPTSHTVYRTPKTVLITAEAGDNVGVSKVWFEKNGVVVATDTTAPYEFSWPIRSVDNGNTVWTATAFDDSGNSATSEERAVTTCLDDFCVEKKTICEGDSCDVLKWFDSELASTTYVAGHAEKREGLDKLGDWVNRADYLQPFKSKVNRDLHQIYLRKDSFSPYYGEIFTFDDNYIYLHAETYPVDKEGNWIPGGDRYDRFRLFTSSGSGDWGKGRIVATRTFDPNFRLSQYLDSYICNSFEEYNQKACEKFQSGFWDSADTVELWKGGFTTVFDGEMEGWSAEGDFNIFDEVLVFSQKMRGIKPYPGEDVSRERFFFARKGNTHFGFVRWDNSERINGVWVVTERTVGLKTAQDAKFSFNKRDGIPGMEDRIENDAFVMHENDAAFVSQVVPTAVPAGQPMHATIRIKNTGGARWTAAKNYRLGSQNPRDNTTWGAGRVELAKDVEPNETAVFELNGIAPQMPGVYNFQWGMIQDHDHWFGALTEPVKIEIISPDRQSLWVLDKDFWPNEIKSYYANILHRDASPAEVSYWTQSEQTLTNVREAFFNSPEFSNLSATLQKESVAWEIARYYRSILNRAEDESGAAHWINAVIQKVSGTEPMKWSEALAAVRLSFIESDEFQRLSLEDKKAGLPPDWGPVLRGGLTFPSRSPYYAVPQTIVIQVSATHGDQVNFEYDGVVVATVTKPVNDTTYEYPWEITEEDGGSHSWRAIVSDKLGFSSSTLLSTVWVDTEPPTLNLVSPLPNTLYLSTQTMPISVSVSDNLGVDKVWFVHGDVVVATVTIPSHDSVYSYDWNILSEGNGSSTWTAVAFDLAGQRASVSSVNLALNVDRTAPTLVASTTHSFLTAGGVSRKVRVTAQNGTDSPLMFNARSSDGVIVTPSPLTQEGTQSTVTFTIDVSSSVSPGTKMISFSVTNRVYSSEEIHLLIDVAAEPVLLDRRFLWAVPSDRLSDEIRSYYSNILHRDASPAEVSYWTQSEQTLTNVREAFFNSPEFSNLSATLQKESVAWEIARYYRSILNRAEDESGAAHWINAVIQKVSGTEPMKWSEALADVRLSFIESVEFQKLSLEDKKAGLPPDWGPVILQGLTFPPTYPSFAAPQTILMSISATHCNRVNFEFDGVVVATITTPVHDTTYAYSWDVTGEDNGPHTWRAIASDSLGFSSSTLSTTVWVDALPPTMNLLSPLPNTLYTSTQTMPITVSASDNRGIEKVWFVHDNVVIATETTPSHDGIYSFDWNVTAEGNGSSTWTAVAFDAAGNNASVSSVNLALDVDRTAPTVVVSSTLTFLTVGGVPREIRVTAQHGTDSPLMFTGLSPDGLLVTTSPLIQEGTRFTGTITIGASASVTAGTKEVSFGIINRVYSSQEIQLTINVAAESVVLDRRFLWAVSNNRLPNEIRSYYSNILHRDCSVEEVGYWAGQNASIPLVNIRDKFFNSTEFAGLPATLQKESISWEIDRYYRTILNRPGDVGGIAYWTGVVISESTAPQPIKWSEALAHIRKTFFDSTEFHNLSPSDQLPAFPPTFHNSGNIVLTPPTTVGGARAYPVPFRPGQGAMGITFDLIPGETAVRIYTIDGRPVKTLTTNTEGTVLWDLTNDDNAPVASGVYLAIIEKDGGRKRLNVVVQK